MLTQVYQVGGRRQDKAIHQNKAQGGGGKRGRRGGGAAVEGEGLLSVTVRPCRLSSGVELPNVFFKRGSCLGTFLG